MKRGRAETILKEVQETVQARSDISAIMPAGFLDVLREISNIGEDKLDFVPRPVYGLLPA